jgi:urease accessory protein UreH
VAGRTANGERDLARNTREESVIYCNSGIVVAADCEMVSGRKQGRSAGSAADGTEGAGLTSRIDVQARRGSRTCSRSRELQRNPAKSMWSARASHILNRPTYE